MLQLLRGFNRGKAMSAAQYFDVQTGQSENAAAPSPLVPTVMGSASMTGAVNRNGQIKSVSVALEEVMFTSRVPLSTWTFAFAINDKLWVSKLTTLYFGKRTAINKNIYRSKMFVPDRGTNLEMDITAYNSYGDMFNMTRDIRVYTNNTANDGRVLVKIDEDWTQLLFKFHVQV